MQNNAVSAESESKDRVAWVDYAKGICIIFVVMMWCTYDYGQAAGAEGWMHHVVAFARPFRMPDFFLLSGLFLAASINSPLREYIDRKVVHFVYFYLLWLAIQLTLTETGLLVTQPLEFLGAFAWMLVEPASTLWFVHMLAIFYVVTRAVRRVPKLTVFLVAAGLQTAYHFGIIHTGWEVANHFFDRYVYFFTGYAAAAWVFDYAKRVRAKPVLALIGLAAWALFNGAMTTAGIDQAPGLSLLLGFLGAAAVVAVGSLLAERDWAGFLAYAGKYSIVIYLTAVLPMKILLKLFVSTNIVPDVGTATALITFGAVVAPLIFHRLIKGTWLNFLYERPQAFRLIKKRAAVEETEETRIPVESTPHIKPEFKV